MAPRTAGFRPIRRGANVLRDTCVPFVGRSCPNYLVSLFEWYRLRRVAMHRSPLNRLLVSGLAAKNVGNVWRAIGVR